MLRAFRSYLFVYFLQCVVVWCGSVVIADLLDWLSSLGHCLHGIVNSKRVFCRRLLEIHLPLGIDVRESRLMRSKVHGQEINA